MRLYYMWQENFTPVGHAASALFLFFMVAGAVPGFWAAWFFCGLDFMYLLALIPSLFLTIKKSKFKTSDIFVANVYEGEKSTVHLRIEAIDKLNAISLGCFRMDTSLSCKESELVSLAAGESDELSCQIQTTKRGAFEISKVAVLLPEINGALRNAFEAGKAELLVFPRPIKIGSFSFLTYGASGMVFAPLLMPSLSRGRDFVGVREYREGDSLRDLHHKAFARYGKPFTKEFETERGAGIVFILDVAARTFKQKSMLEMLIRLAAGIGLWLMERGTLGRFFIGDNEISLVSEDAGKSLFESLARIPSASLLKSDDAKKLWSPAARPLGPVLRLGLFATEDPLVHKHIVLESRSSGSKELKIAVEDNVLTIDGSRLEQMFNMQNEMEVSL